MKSMKITIFTIKLKSNETIDFYINFQYFWLWLLTKGYGTVVLCIAWSYNWYLLKAHDLADLLNTQNVWWKCVKSFWKHLRSNSLALSNEISKNKIFDYTSLLWGICGISLDKTKESDFKCFLKLFYALSSYIVGIQKVR